MSVKNFIILFSLLVFAKCSKSENMTGDSIKTTFTNPVWNGADPWMVKHGNEYIYCYSANNSIVVSRSRFMTKKGDTRTIWKAPKTGWNSNCVWAPEIHFIDGHWYVYYAAGESGPPFIHQRTGVLRSKNSDVFSDYEDMGMLYTGDNPKDPASNIWAIDMTVFEYRGKLYAVWSGWLKQVDTDKTSQHLFIQEMENPYHIKRKTCFAIVAGRKLGNRRTTEFKRRSGSIETWRQCIYRLLLP